MKERSNLAQWLNLENDEEFKIKGRTEYTYRIHNGEFQFSSSVCRCWIKSTRIDILTAIINDPSQIIRRLLFSDIEMMVLEHYFDSGIASICRLSNGNLSFKFKDGVKRSNELPSIKPGDTVDLVELFGKEQST